MRSRSTSSCSPIAPASFSAISTSSAIRVVDPGAARLPAPDRLRRARMRCFRTTTASSSGFDLLREYFMFPRKFLGFELDALDAVLPQLQGEDGRHPVRLRRGQSAARRRGAARMFALYAAPAVNLFEKTTDRIPRQIEPARIPRRSGPQPLPRLRAAPHPRCLRALSPAAATRCRSARSIRPRSTGGARTPGSTTRCAGCRGGAPSRRGAIGASSDYTGTDMFISLASPPASTTTAASPS